MIMIKHSYKNIKNGMIFIFAIVILILCGLLPIIIAKIQDYAADEKVVYEDVKTVQLLHELNDMEKLYLLKSGSYVEITEERAKLNTEHMQEILTEGILQVGHSLIYGNISDFTIEYKPIFYYSNEFSELSAIFWHIKMELWDDMGQSILLCLDDTTGKVLSISYECLEPIYLSKKIDYYLENLFQNYCAQMDFYEIVQSFVEVEANEEVSEKLSNKKRKTFRMADTLYGEIEVECTMTETGFCIEIK